MSWPTRYARAAPGFNHVLAYGQSLSTGWEGWPALSTAPLAGAFMLGESVRPRSEHAPVWEAVGGAALRPLVATVQDLSTGALLTPPDIARLEPGALALGETVLEGAIAEWLSRGPADPARMVVASACGVGGRSLEALSKGASPELFNRLRGCVRAAQGAAAAAGVDFGVVALLFLQGEHNSWGVGGTSDRGLYKALLTRLYADFLADIVGVTAGQTAPPAMFLYQTGGNYASQDNAVAQAQLEFALEVPLCFLASPVYPVTDKGGHLDANGYRWLGAQFGKVMHRVLTLGEQWRPLHPIEANADGLTVTVTFEVPVPPLAWGRPFCATTRHEVPQRGFSALDNAGEVAIAEVALAGPKAVRITLDRRLGAGAMLRYAAASHLGLGALHDSDASVSVSRYQPEPGTRAPPGPDLREVAGRPYSLQNWCTAFAVPVHSRQP